MAKKTTAGPASSDSPDAVNAPEPLATPAAPAVPGAQDQPTEPHATGAPPAAAPDANAGAAPAATTNPGAPTPTPTPDREAQVLAKLEAIGDPYGQRQAINAEIIAAKDELAVIVHEYKAAIAALEDRFRDAEEKARWAAEDKRLLEMELAAIRTSKAAAIANAKSDASARAIRAQVEAELARSGVTS